MELKLGPDLSLPTGFLFVYATKTELSVCGVLFLSGLQ